MKFSKKGLPNGKYHAGGGGRQKIITDPSAWVGNATSGLNYLDLHGRNKCDTPIEILVHPARSPAVARFQEGNRHVGANPGTAVCIKCSHVSSPVPPVNLEIPFAT
jgi:hypothetical protein